MNCATLGRYRLYMYNFANTLVSHPEPGGLAFFYFLQAAQKSVSVLHTTWTMNNVTLPAVPLV